MPIEIKELHIKVTIEEDKATFQSATTLDKLQLEQLKTTMIRECTAKVLEKLKDREER
jgi:hypothetical protein